MSKSVYFDFKFFSKIECDRPAKQYIAPPLQPSPQPTVWIRLLTRPQNGCISIEDRLPTKFNLIIPCCRVREQNLYVIASAAKQSLAQTWHIRAEFYGLYARSITVALQCSSHVAPGQALFMRLPRRPAQRGTPRSDVCFFELILCSLMQGGPFLAKELAYGGT